MIDDGLNKVDISTIPLGDLLAEVANRSQNYCFAVVDENINEEGTLIHFELQEKFPGSMGKIMESIHTSSAECCDDYIIRTLQGGKRFSSLGTSVPDDDEDQI